MVIFKETAALKLDEEDNQILCLEVLAFIAFYIILISEDIHI